MKSPKVPAPPPDTSAADAKKRLEAERAAIAESKAAGRRSTMAAGNEIAAEEQYGRGLLSQKKRAAARTAMGM